MKNEYSNILKFGPPPKSLLKAGERLIYKKNTIIHSPGDILKGFYYVEKGRVVCVDYTEKGNENIEFILEKESTFLESLLIFDIPVISFFKTLEDTELIFIKKEYLLELLKTDYEVTLFVIKSVTQKFLAKYFQCNDMLFFDTEWRICNLFLQMSYNYGVKKGNKIKLDLKISQQFISNILGINRITAARIIKKLKDMNVIEQTNGFYYITDIQKLRNHQSKIQLSI